MRGRARGDSAMHELGGHAGLLEKHGEWLGSSTGPHTKESVDGKVRPVVQQGVDLLWVK